MLFCSSETEQNAEYWLSIALRSLMFDYKFSGTDVGIYHFTDVSVDLFSDLK